MDPKPVRQLYRTDISLSVPGNQLILLGRLACNIFALLSYASCAQFGTEILLRLWYFRSNVTRYTYHRMSHDTHITECHTIHISQNVTRYTYHRMSHDTLITECHTIGISQNVTRYAYHRMSHDTHITECHKIHISQNVTRYTYHRMLKFCLSEESGARVGRSFLQVGLTHKFVSCFRLLEKHVNYYYYYYYYYYYCYY
jgi:hypothetical protein